MEYGPHPCDPPAVPTLADEAIDALYSTVEALLPPAPEDATLAPTVLVSPRTVGPAGLGGFVAVNEEPVGDIVAARVNAEIEIVVRAASAKGLNKAVDKVTRGFVSRARETLRQRGVLRVSLGTVGDVVAKTGGTKPRFERELTFQVLYEFVKTPTEPGGGVITEIPLTLDTEA